MELTRRWVRDGLGSGGISAALGETDLGGTTMLTRIRVIFWISRETRKEQAETGKNARASVV